MVCKMSLSQKQKRVLKEIENTQEFRRQRRITCKLVFKNMVDHVGKGFYYFIEHSRPDERIMDIITDNIVVKNGGYLRHLHHWKKGNKCNLQLLESYEKFNESAAKFGVGVNKARCNIDGMYQTTVKNNNVVNNKGETNCDIVVIQIGGTSNGYYCRPPSTVSGKIVIRTISESQLKSLEKIEREEDRDNCLIM